ncbi:MAG: hypothetical protein LBT43_20225, partial [Prevotella sp.]|nr:hypothetical protein [Prevotella sp.]
SLSSPQIDWPFSAIPHISACKNRACVRNMQIQFDLISIEQNKVYSQPLDLVNKAKTATEILNEVLGIPFTMPIWAEETLEDLVGKYRNMELTQDNIDKMRTEFKDKGLESLMPTALKEVFTR